MEHCTGLFIVGHFFNRGGYADMAHQYARACAEHGIPARLLPTGDAIPEVRAAWEETVARSRDADLGPNPYVLVIDIPPRFRMVDVQSVRRVIGVTIFEGDSLPFEWATHCGLVDEVWVPTDFNLRTFAAGGVHRDLLRKLPLAIDTGFWDAGHSANVRRPVHHGDQPVRLLYVCSLHRRKGLDRLMAAYVREFQPDEPVHLTVSCFPIRSGGLNQVPITDDASLRAYLESLGRSLGGASGRLPALTAHFRYWSESELRQLFFEASAYVSTERADGWALPVMHMMCLGKPSLLLGWGGSSEYARTDSAYLIPPGPLEAVDPHLASATAWYRGQRWPQMRVADVQRAMRSLFEDIRRGEVARANTAREVVLREHGYTALGQRIATAIGWDSGSLGDGVVAAPVVNVRTAPWAGTWLHALLSRLRTLVGGAVAQRVAVLMQCSEDAETLRRLAAAAGVAVDVHVAEQDIEPEILRDVDAVVAAHFELWQLLRLVAGAAGGNPARQYTYDLVEQILVSGGPAAKVSRPAVFLSGGLTGPVAKLITARGLHRCPLITHVEPVHQPGSWSLFGQRVQAAEAGGLGLTHVFVADESESQQRQSYQQAELFLEAADIRFVCPPECTSDLPRLSDEQQFRRSLPKRWRGANRGSLRRVVLAPCIRSRRALTTALTRMPYFFPPDTGIEVALPVAADLLAAPIEAHLGQRVELEPVYGPLVDAPASNLKLIDESELPARIAEVESATAIWSLDQLTHYERRLLNLSENLLLLDVDHPGMRSGFASASALYFCQSRESVKTLRARSRERLQALVERLRGEGRQWVAAFGTGPSLASAFDHDFSDAITIACNTMVKDRKLMQHLRPAVIVASDADFHFGPSVYAQQFRTDLCRMLAEHDAIFVCPEAHAELVVRHHPEIEPRLIAIPVDGSAVNFDLTREFRVRAIDNVLLQFLFPLSATLGRRIALLGFDGRRKGDTKFWTHNVSTQYPELMGAIEESHPGFFFHRCYTDYFDRHCRLIDEYVAGIEAIGGQVCSLADSAVPALAARLQTRLAET